MGCERKRTKRVLRFCPEQLKLTYSYVAKTKRGAGVEEGKGTLGAQFWTNWRCFSSKYEMKCSIGNCNFETTTTLMAENKEELKSL